MGLKLGPATRRRRAKSSPRHLHGCAGIINSPYRPARAMRVRAWAVPIHRPCPRARPAMAGARFRPLNGALRFSKADIPATGRCDAADHRGASAESDVTPGGVLTRWLPVGVSHWSAAVTVSRRRSAISSGMR